MTECLSVDRFEFNETQIAAVRKVGGKALTIATDRYGSGFPDYKGGHIRKLGYNNGRHDRIVGDDGARLAAYVGLSEAEQELARVSGYAHDIRQLTGRGNDERESAEWIEEHLRDTGEVPAAAAQLAALAILGTLPVFKDGRVVDHTANRLKFTSERDELFVKGLSSADTSELYTPIGPYSAHMLYLQRQEDNPDISELKAFQANQIAFLDDYEYPLTEAKELFATHEAQVKRYVQFVYDQIERGDITSLEQLLAQDLAFMRNPDEDFTRNSLHLVA